MEYAWSKDSLTSIFLGHERLRTRDVVERLNRQEALIVELEGVMRGQQELLDAAEEAIKRLVNARKEEAAQAGWP